jgi:anaerobic carbon-monoxide dehydrogenase iron sulfur subunit
MKRVWVDQDKCLGCKTCELQCAVERGSVAKTLAGAVQEDPKPVARVGVFGQSGSSFPLQCRHCEDATCLKACPAGAAQRDEEKGHTFIDQTKCRGCWMCVMSCPFGAVTPSAAFKVAVKCDACAQMEEPACVASCPTGALIYEDEAGFGKVLAQKRGRIAAFVRTGTDPKIFGLDFVRGDD